MSKLLTPQEVLQAIIDGKKLECRWYNSPYWVVFLPSEHHISIANIINHNKNFIFRLAQEKITIGGMSFPKPESKAPELGTKYWTPNPFEDVFEREQPLYWQNDRFDNQCLQKGMLHLSKENAIAHAKALIELSGGNVDD